MDFGRSGCTVGVYGSNLLAGRNWCIFIGSPVSTTGGS